MPEALQIPLSRRAAFTQESYNEADNTIEIVFATEAEVLRRSWDGVNYIEILECRKKSVRMERMHAGANLVDSHRTWGIESILGVVERAWIENDECKAIVRLSKREEVAGYVQDIVSGIIRNVSVGYAIHQTKITEDADNNTITVRVTDWEPAELSVLSVPADFKAGTRSQDQPQRFHEIKIDKKNMPNPEENSPEQRSAASVNPGSPAPAAPATPAASSAQVDENTVRTEATAAERTRVSEITGVVRAAKIDDADFLEGLIKEGKTLDQARSAVLDRLTTEQPPVTRTQTTVTGAQELEKTRSGLEEVLLHRHNSTNELKSEEGKKYRHATLLDMAGILLRAQGQSIDVGSLSRTELVKRALSTTDFPLMLGNTINRSLRAAYDLVTPEWRKFARKRSASDFKELTSVGVGGDFKLKKIQEGGEYKEVNMLEEADGFKLNTYGRKIIITRHAIINDDLGAFMRMTELFGRGAAEMQAEIVYNLLAGNSGNGRVLSDGKALFHTEHKNLATGGGSALSATTLTAARVAMRRQKGLGNDKILVRPRYLVVPPELETTAWQLVNAQTNPTIPTEANPFKGAFEVVVDAFLENTTAWYLIADPATIPVIDYAFLDGNEGLYTEQQVDFNTDNLEVKVRTDFAATIEEFRGVYKGKGA